MVCGSCHALHLSALTGRGDARSELLSLPFFGSGGSHGSFGQILADRVESKRTTIYSCLRAVRHWRAALLFLCADGRISAILRVLHMPGAACPDRDEACGFSPLHGSGYSCTSGIGKSLRLSVSNAQPRSIVIAATIVSASVNVWPFRAQVFFRRPASRALGPLSSYNSKPLSSASVLLSSAGRMPA